jgi:hypothetical protein
VREANQAALRHPELSESDGSLLALDRRARLLEWAERRDLLIVEDDPYGSLYFDDVASEQETRPLRADDANGRVLYLSTVSKTLAPGFRVGWMVAPPMLIERFDTAKQSSDLTSGILDQCMVIEALRRGVIDRLAPRLRELYRTKRDAMEAAIREYAGGRLTWSQPKGGFFIWATLPDGLRDADVPRARIGAWCGVRDRQRIPRGRQRSQHHSPVFFGPHRRSDSRRHSSSGGDAAGGALRRGSGRPARSSRGRSRAKAAGSLPSPAGDRGRAVSGSTAFSLNIISTGRSPIARPSRVIARIDTAKGAGVASDKRLSSKQIGRGERPDRYAGPAIEGRHRVSASYCDDAVEHLRCGNWPSRQWTFPDLIAVAAIQGAHEVVQRDHEDQVTGRRDADDVAAEAESPGEPATIRIERVDLVARRSRKDTITSDCRARDLARQRANPSESTRHLPRRGPADRPATRRRQSR